MLCVIKRGLGNMSESFVKHDFSHVRFFSTS